MKAVVYQGPGDIVVSNLPEPRVEERRDAVVRVTRSGICGTDLHPFRGELPDFAPGTVLGHEFAGVVVEAGPDAQVTVGERVFASDVVACGRCALCARGWHYQCPEATLFGYADVVGKPLSGGQAEYVRVPYADVVLRSVPEGVSDEQALFVSDVLTTAYTAVRAAALTPGDTVGVVGAGPVGLLAGRCAAIAGAGRVIVCDPASERRTAAESLGLQAVVPGELGTALREAAGTRGAAAVIEAVGSDAALRAAVEAAGPRSTVVAAGAHHSSAMPFPTGLAFGRELTLRFTVGDPIALREDVLPLITQGLLDPSAVVTHRLPLSRAAEAYALFDGRAALKVVLSP
ncbi:MAG: alcohol dehydrogenase catalytic domain-containing protein [Streptomyces sp.]|nr:alcohol dehydrogenase catalytic domain-containing protein [Streptomyces sp.]